MTNPNFTPAQLIAIRDGLFGTLDSDFNYGLGKPKRQAAIAKWQKATNFDALMQRAKKQEHPLARGNLLVEVHLLYTSTNNSSALW